MNTEVRTAGTAGGRGEARKGLVAFQLERAPVRQALAAARWLADNAVLYRSYAASRTNLALTPGAAEIADFERVADVLHSIERDPGIVFGQEPVPDRAGMADLVAALGGAVGFERRH